MQRSVSAVENSKIVLLETNLALVDYYRSEGIVFSGECRIGDVINRSGAMWASPDGPSTAALAGTDFHTEHTDVSFRAARALLGKEQAEIAELAKISIDTIKGLERRGHGDRSYNVLRRWYEEQGVQFTGWGDTASQKYYGVGVRWHI